MFGRQAQRVDPRPGLTGDAGHWPHVFHGEAAARGQGGAQGTRAFFDQDRELHRGTGVSAALFARLQALGDIAGDASEPGECGFSAFTATGGLLRPSGGALQRQQRFLTQAIAGRMGEFVI